MTCGTMVAEFLPNVRQRREILMTVRRLDGDDVSIAQAKLLGECRPAFLVGGLVGKNKNLIVLTF